MFKSFFHWKVLVNIVLALAVFAGLVWLTFRWLEFHTNHGEEIPVPNVMNMTVHDAIKVLDDSGLEYEVDSAQFNPKFKPFQVLLVSPSPGSHVKGGRTVLLKVNPRTWAKVAVPDIIDRYKGLAFNQLNLVGLKVGDTLYEPSIQRDAVLRILFQNRPIKPGELLPKFSTVDLVIGSGPLRNVTIPNLVGRTVQEAKKIIAQNLFEVGIVEYESGTADDAAIIYYQDPPAGALRDQGMQIDLWASHKTPAEMFNKVKELDLMYRPKIDTVAPPPIRYEEVEVDQPAAVVPKPAPEKKPETPKTTTTNNNSNTANKPAAEKPKEKKKVIVE
ncbi:PASTA domain-containing protein [Chryseobacterium sp. POL2]|uniref:PASTA domain-containing protein n=1 Tax=Chryseobacterium sp. POL2 TaxID=2713414 RepID=UPI0013E1DBE5|nr:PASTA domain-containing protein [Chryseobacterium sp. POL2]QIG89208.1 PASTA domain-containing protein [Chryseobacterium sp. POL2]